MLQRANSWAVEAASFWEVTDSLLVQWNQEISPEHDGGHGIDSEEEPDDEGVAVE